MPPAARAPRSKPDPEPPRPAVHRRPAPESLRAYVAYRREELAFEEKEIQANAGYGIGGGALISRGERVKTITLYLEELDRLAAWLEAGEPMYVPPLSAEDKRQWRWAREHGMEVPEHIAEQL